MLSESDLNSYTGRYKCLDNAERDLNLRGNYDTTIASNLMAVFDLCNNATSTIPCKPQEEIDEFIEFKYFISV